MKLAVIGKGTVGSLAVLHFLTYTDWDIDWVSDPNTPTTAVGEGTTIRVPSALANSILEFSHDDLILDVINDNIYSYCDINDQCKGYVERSEQ